jgi:hypothetical protein
MANKTPNAGTVTQPYQGPYIGGNNSNPTGNAANNGNAGNVNSNPNVVEGLGSASIAYPAATAAQKAGNTGNTGNTSHAVGSTIGLNIGID